MATEIDIPVVINLSNRDIILHDVYYTAFCTCKNTIQKFSGPLSVLFLPNFCVLVKICYLIMLQFLSIIPSQFLCFGKYMLLDNIDQLNDYR